MSEDRAKAAFEAMMARKTPRHPATDLGRGDARDARRWLGTLLVDAAEIVRDRRFLADVDVAEDESPALWVDPGRQDGSPMIGCRFVLHPARQVDVEFLSGGTAPTDTSTIWLTAEAVWECLETWLSEALDDAPVQPAAAFEPR